LKGLDFLLAIGPTLTSRSILFELLQALRISVREIIVLRRIGPGIGGDTIGGQSAIFTPTPTITIVILLTTLQHDFATERQALV